jgi:cobalt/nickel transport system permease protein
MNSEIYLIDYYATSINSIIHKSSLLIKVAFTAFFLLVIITSTKSVQFILYIIIICLLILTARLPLLRILRWALYPVVFGLMFAVSQIFYSPTLAQITVLRVFSTVLLMLLFVNTTGFTTLFSLIPSKTLRNTFLLSYRFFFMIIDSMSSRMNILKIRGIGSAKLIRRLNAISSVIAHSLIHTIEKAERVYRIMLIRGYNGRIGMHKHFSFTPYDIIFIILSGGLVYIWLT